MRRSLFRNRNLPLSILCFLLGSGFLLPAYATSDARERVTISGVLDVVQEDDFATGQSRRIHFLKESATGKLYRLDLQGPIDPDVMSGARANVQGLLQGTEIRIAPGVGGIDVVAPASLPSGARKAVVLIVDFQDSTVSCSESTLANVMFDGAQSIDGLYRESSFDQVSFPRDTDQDGQADVFRVSIGASISEACDPFGWADLAEAAAEQAGVSIGLYQHKVFALPSNTMCNWAGYGNIGCSGSCRSWSAMCHLADVYAHELGHNLGMRHASTDLDNDDQIDCTYCDLSDFMGYAGAGWRQPNGPHKEQLGWIEPAQVVELSQTGTQTHTLSALESDPGTAPHPQVLKVFNPGTNDDYYLTFRTPSGYDSTLGADYANKINIHRYDATGSNNTLFIDSLGDSEEFQCDTMTVTQLTHDANSATIEVSFAAMAPVENSVRVTQGAGLTQLSWDPVAGVGEYNVYRGFRTSGNLWSYNQQCLDAAVPGLSASDPADPRSFTVFYYLVSSSSGASESIPGRDSDDNSIPLPYTCPAVTLDVDGDGIDEHLDNCPGLLNATQTDTDDDAHGDLCDNCPLAFNPDQVDADGDGLGAPCDTDRDGDGVDNAIDNCPDTPNPDQADGDSDGIGDICDLT